MTGPRYRVKLYGQSGDDPDTFKRSLAAVLAIGPEKVEDILERVPVPIKEDLSLAEAEKLKDIIGIFKGLCIVEPMDGRWPTDVVPAARPQRPATLTQSILDPRNRAALMVGVGGVLLVFFFLAAFALTPKIAVRDHGAASVFGSDRSGVARPSLKSSAETQFHGMTVEELDHVYTTLETDVSQLKEELADLQQQLHKATSMTTPDNREVGDLTERSLTARDEFRAKLKRMQAVKRRMDSLRFEQDLQMGSTPAEQFDTSGE